MWVRCLCARELIEAPRRVSRRQRSLELSMKKRHFDRRSIVHCPCCLGPHYFGSSLVLSSRAILLPPFTQHFRRALITRYGPTFPSQYRGSCGIVHNHMLYSLMAVIVDSRRRGTDKRSHDREDFRLTTIRLAASTPDALPLSTSFLVVESSRKVRLSGINNHRKIAETWKFS